jgi:class 3 adenylate cyclase
VIRRALQAGLVTGTAMAALVLLIYVAWDALHRVWPIAFVPVFFTGVYSVHRAAPRDARHAALVGALAGLVAAAVSTIAVFAAGIAAGPTGAASSDAPYNYWDLFPTFTSPPFNVPLTTYLVNLPFLFPFTWTYSVTLPGGTQVSRLPLAELLFIPGGVLLSAAQAALYHALRPAPLGPRLVDRIARVRASYRSKLLAGFALLTLVIFVTGWLGFASTEEMHTRVHEGRAMQHWLEHDLQIQDDLRAQAEALARLTATRDDATLQRVEALGRKIATDLAHLKAVPSPGHLALTSVGGYILPYLTKQAQDRHPQVVEADARYADLAAATTRALTAYRASDAAGFAAQANALMPLRTAAEGALRSLASDIDRDIGVSGAQADSASHAQQLLAMLGVLVVTAVAFPLGYLFSQVVVRPVTAVDEGLERIGRSEFAQPVVVTNRDELGALAERVNKVGGQLDRSSSALRSLNQGLEEKVQEHVREIERSRMLRRYLPQQVADAVIASGDESLLQTHRREITVVFGDLRGFTAFAETGEPEVIMGVLAEYHGAVGEQISKFAGTLEQFSGDGWMVYFNDPLPVADHPARAVRMSVALRERIGELARQWRRLGYELDFGIGIAIGYATLGTIGFEGRHDYGAIGTVANLASRLSDEAKGGQILVSQRVSVLVEGIVETEPVGELQLKGFLKPVSAYNVVALKESLEPA